MVRNRICPPASVESTTGLAHQQTEWATTRFTHQTAVADIAIETASGINRYRNCSVSNFSCNQRHQPLQKLGSGSGHRYGNPGQPFVLSTAASTAIEISGNFVLQTAVVDIAIETKWSGSNPLQKLQSGNFGCIQRHQPLWKLVNSGTIRHRN